MATIESLAKVKVPLEQIDQAQAERAEYERLCAQLYGQLEAANAKLADAKIANKIYFGTKKHPRSGLLLFATAKYGHTPDILGHTSSHAAFIVSPTAIYVNMGADSLSHLRIFDSSPRDEADAEYLAEYLRDFTERGFNYALLQQAITASIEMTKPKTPDVSLERISVNS